MPTLSKKKEQLQQQAKNGYWENELHSLGISEPKESKELDENKEELETFQTLSNSQCFRIIK
ncbi:MAG: hypothetical protein ACJ718_11465 [Nitrososphaeraceae archaeon]